MHPHFRVGRLLGIEIGVHLSWFVIAFLLTLSLGTHFRGFEPAWSEATIWGCALVTSLLFFVTLVLHELAHALVARARGLPVGAITLFALGGISRIEKDAEDPGTEFLIGIAGPATSLAIGGLCLGAAALVGWRPDVDDVAPVPAVLSWLGYINFALAVFNLVPGFPLDGGRVLRAALWRVTGERSRATRAAARVGQVVAFGLVFVGVFRFFTGVNVGGLWLAFIGWFLLSAAGSSYREARALDQLQTVRVGDVMSRDCVLLEHDTTIADFVRSQLLRTGRRCFVVEKDGLVAGLVAPQDIRAVPRSRWADATVAEVMRPLTSLRTTAPEASVSEAFLAMGQGGAQQIPVLASGRQLVGVISRGDILRLLQTRAELG